MGAGWGAFYVAGWGVGGRPVEIGKLDGGGCGIYRPENIGKLGGGGLREIAVFIAGGHIAPAFPHPGYSGNAPYPIFVLRKISNKETRECNGGP